MKKVFSLFAAALFAVSMFADPFTLTFKDWGDTTPKADKDNAPSNTVGDSSTAYTTENLKDSIDGAAFMGDVTDATKLYAARVGYGLKLGSSSATGKLAFNLATPAEFDSIVFLAASYSATEGSVKFNGEEAIDLTNSGADNKLLKNVVITPVGVVSSVSVETTVKRAFLKSITFYPKAEADTTTVTGIVYELNGGQFNPRNFTSEQDMFWGYIQDYNAFANVSFDSTAMEPSQFYNKTYGKTDPWTMFDDATYGPDWAWLKTYIISRVALFQDIDEAAAAAALSASVARGALDNFFNNGALNAAAWNKSFDATSCGISSDLWRGAWGYTFGNPSTVAEGATVTLISPYKTGYIFKGWYASADFTGDAVTTITSATTGTLYAKWEENNATEITYVLNGGVTNEYGWATPKDMFWAYIQDYNAYAGVSFDSTAMEPSQFYSKTYGKTDPWTMFDDATYGPAWAWLKTYIISRVALFQDIDEAAAAAALSASVARGALDNFFNNGALNAAAWNKSFDATTCGVNALDAYQPYWKHSFNNPTQPTDTVDLYAPYMEGYTFEGWYAAEDFSGPKVTTVNPSTVGTLYAKFVEYIPTVKEIVAMADSVNTKVKGIVNHIDGRTLYVTDATGGLLVYCKTTPSCQVGDVITANGMKVTYYGAPEVSGAEITATETGKLADPIAMTIGDLVANPMKYLAQRVSITGVKIVAYDNYNNPTVKEGTDEVLCYKVVLDTVAFPIGKKVNFTAVVGYHNALQFVGNAADFSLAMAAGKDAAAYEVKTSETGATYTLTNDWLYSNYLGNFAANKPNPLAEQCRSMVVKNGVMYFPWRYSNATEENARLIRVDATTGEMMDPLVLPAKVMRQYTDTASGEFATDGEIIFASCSDLKMDEAGHLLLMNLQTGNIFQVWEIDETTGDANCLIYMGGLSGVDGLVQLFPDAANSEGQIRADRMGILGDVHADGSIFLAQNANGNVFRYDFVDGVFDGLPVQIACANPSDPSGETAASFGDAPQIYPVSDELFYVDGASTFPTLYDGDGNALASFLNDEEKAILLAADANASQSPNGVREFELNGEYFMVMAGSNYDAGDGAANSTTLVFKCLDENRNFNEMTPYWTLPQDGMSQVNRQGVDPQRVCVSQIDVDEANHTATIYIYAAEQGYGKYTLLATPVVDGVENLEGAEGVQKLIKNGQVYIIKNGVRYSVLGQVVE